MIEWKDDDSGVNDAPYLRLYTMPHSECFALIIPFILKMIQRRGIITCISDSSSKGMDSNGLQYLLKVTQLIGFCAEHRLSESDAGFFLTLLFCPPCLLPQGHSPHIGARRTGLNPRQVQAKEIMALGPEDSMSASMPMTRWVPESVTTAPQCHSTPPAAFAEAGGGGWHRPDIRAGYDFPKHPLQPAVCTEPHTG